MMRVQIYFLNSSVCSRSYLKKSTSNKGVSHAIGTEMNKLKFKSEILNKCGRVRLSVGSSV